MKNEEMLLRLQASADIVFGYAPLHDAVTQAINQLRWRSVEDELPVIGKVVRCTDGTNECYGWMSTMAFAGKSWVLDKGHDYKPMFWQPLSPLPQPPE